MNKPAPWNEHDAGHGQQLAAIASIRKGQAFTSPLIPNKRTGTVKGRSASCGRLTMAHRVRWQPWDSSMATRKVKAGRGLQSGSTDQEPANQQARIVMLVFVSGGLAPRFMNMAFQLANRWGCFKPFAAGKESYV